MPFPVNPINNSNSYGRGYNPGYGPPVPPPPPPIFPNNLLAREGPSGPPGPQGPQGPSGTVENVGGAYNSNTAISISVGSSSNLVITGSTFQTSSSFDSTGITLPTAGRYQISYNLEVEASAGLTSAEVTTTLAPVSGSLTYNEILTDVQVVANSTKEKLKGTGVVHAGANAKFNINVATTGIDVTVNNGYITVQLIAKSS